MLYRLAHIALVDDRPEHNAKRREAIEHRGGWPYLVETTLFSNADELIDGVDRDGKFFDVIITDVFMPQRGAAVDDAGTPEAGAIRIKEWLRRKREEDPDFRFVQLRWISRHSDVSDFVQRHITIDDHSWLQYLTHHDKSSFYAADFLPMVTRALAMSLPTLPDLDLPRTVVAQSTAMLKIFQEAARIAATDLPVLISGETGVGKEEVAKFIHAHSGRQDRPFIPVNVTAVPDSLIETEYFGHVKGAFTGAEHKRPGLFASVHGGTLFLDELAEMPPAHQAKLLRVLQEKEVRPAGSDESTKVDFRLICATNKDLREEVAAGRFREDLYYRVKVLQLRVPALRERRDDIPLLVDYFIKRSAQEQHKLEVSIDSEALDRLRAYHWPGNLRELDNAIKVAVALLPGRSGTITLDQLGEDLGDEQATPGMSPSEQRYYEAFMSANGNMAEAARYLGVSRQMVQKMIDGRRRSDGRFRHPTLHRACESARAALDLACVRPPCP